MDDVVVSSKDFELVKEVIDPWRRYSRSRPWAEELGWVFRVFDSNKIGSQGEGGYRLEIWISSFETT